MENSCLDHKEELYRIGLFASINHVSIKTLHYYEKEGLLLPYYVDKDNGYRYYTLGQMAILHRISALKNAGFTIEEIKNINDDNLQNIIINKKARIMKEIAKLTKQLAIIEDYSYEDQLDALVNIEIIPEQIICYMEATIDNYDEIFDLMIKFGNKMEALNVNCGIPDYCFTSYLDNEYKDNNLHIRVCQSVMELKDNTSELTFVKEDNIQVASIYHKGSYHNFRNSYAKILDYINKNNYVICGNIRERYIDGIWNKDDESEWLTQIQIPIKKS